MEIIWTNLLALREEDHLKMVGLLLIIGLNNFFHSTTFQFNLNFPFEGSFILLKDLTPWQAYSSRRFHY